MEAVTLSVALDRLLKAKEASKRRSRYILALKRAIQSFISTTGDLPVSDITEDHVEGFLSVKGVNPWSRRTYVSRLSTLFEFSRRRRWLVENPCCFLEQVAIDRTEPVILTPDQASHLVHQCRVLCPRGLPWLLLCLYAGLRPEEAAALSWEAIDWENRRIWVDASVSKVRQRRIVEPPGRFFYLLSCAQKGGALPLPHSTKRRVQRRLKATMGWKSWPKDILRHTCASYWLALVCDAQRVSLQLGNSPEVLFRHYRAVVTGKEAAMFFGEGLVGREERAKSNPDEAALGE